VLVEKISVLGCGWTGLPVAKELNARGYVVKGSTTRIGKMGEVALSGTIPFIVLASPTLEGERLSAFLDCSTLIITMPPPKKEGQPDWATLVHKSIIRNAIASGVKKVVLFSSTSVYPNLNRAVKEEDAVNQASAHSGIDIKAIEDLYLAQDAFEVLVTRFGGLFGPGRHPGRFMRNGNSISCSESPVNLVHQTDVVNAVLYLIQQGCKGIYNVCSPEHPTRNVFYSAAFKDLGMEGIEGDQKSCEFKEVSSEKLIEAGYQFYYSNPLMYF
jgi:hypothetical protein